MLFKDGEPSFSAHWSDRAGEIRLQLIKFYPLSKYRTKFRTTSLTLEEIQVVIGMVNAHPVLGHEWALNVGATDPDPAPGTIPPPHAPNGPQRPPTPSTVHQSAILQGFRHALSILSRRRAIECHPWGLAVLTDAEVMLLAELKVLENPLGPPVIGDPK